MIKRGNQVETGDQIINQLAAEKNVIYFLVTDQIQIFSLIPVLDFLRLAFVDYSLVFDTL
jgi:hypothetical protein